MTLTVIGSSEFWLALPALLAFSAGLAGVLVLIGILVVQFRNFAGSRPDLAIDEGEQSEIRPLDWPDCLGRQVGEPVRSEIDLPSASSRRTSSVEPQRPALRTPHRSGARPCGPP